MAHSSFYEYANTNRIFKHYTFSGVGSEAIKAKGVSFSSYPGMLESLDDFYLMSSGLAMTQTSNNVFDNSLLDLITPRSLLAWQRVRTASLLAGSGGEWAAAFAKQASGTYVNQYMVSPAPP